ncbi:MAG: hypothetical protein IKG08_01410 [Eubacterium sp.]|nr:hypothetical protein [Eubacterium sp.]
MRTVRILRPKRFESGGNKLQVDVDGKQEGKLSNGKEITLQLDENSHELSLHGGIMQGKGFACKLTVPSGSYSYTFQVDMMEASGNAGYKPVLRPTDGQRLKDQIRAISLIGTNSTIILMNEEIRKMLKNTPNATVQLVLSENSWLLGMDDGNRKVKLFEQNYASTTGGIMAAINTAAQKAAVEDHNAAIDTISGEYYRFLPDYELLSPGILRFKG